jgi:sigma-B regulation protein RsbU (phosphoserine phosphatase)
MFYARFHRSTRTLEYASGGHNPPILLRPTGEVVSLDQSGPILGILDGTQFSDTTVPLEPGDILVLYTDGVTEQENPQEEEFSLDRVQQVILNKASEPAAVIIADLAEAVSTFAGLAEQSDDFTLVIMKVT